jgi:hypothetical protein
MRWVSNGVGKLLRKHPLVNMDINSLHIDYFEKVAKKTYALGR